MLGKTRGEFHSPLFQYRLIDKYKIHDKMWEMKRIYPWELPDWAKPETTSPTISLIKAVALDILKKPVKEKRRIGGRGR